MWPEPLMTIIEAESLVAEVEKDPLHAVIKVEHPSSEGLGLTLPSPKLKLKLKFR